MAYSNKIFGFVGRLLEKPDVRLPEDKVPFARCLLEVIQVKTDQGNWESVAKPHKRRVVAYQHLAKLCQKFEEGDMLQFECRKKSTSWTDEDGMTRNGTEWTVIGMRQLLSAAKTGEPTVQNGDDVPVVLDALLA